MRRLAHAATFGIVLMVLFLGPDPLVWATASDWLVPTEADVISNPVPVSQDSLGKGAVIFQQRCTICHGETGRGDGPSALSLGVRPAALTDRDILAQPDGRLFWKIAIGRGPMPNWDLILSEEDRWHIVNYLRALSTAP